MKSNLLVPERGILASALSLKTVLLSLLAAAGLLALPAQAVPYASGVTNNAGTVSFILNESADNVTVVFDGGASSMDMGGLAAGSYSFGLGAHTSFAIEVRKNSTAGYLTGVSNRIGVASNPLTFFFIPRGVAVNRNPASPNFGRIYVAEGGGGTTAASGARTTTDGIFILKADQSDALGQGNNGRTNGVYFANSVSAPWKIEVGEDDALYIADLTTEQANIWVADPDVSSISNLLAGVGAAANTTVHTTITGSPVPLGSLGAGNLTVWAIDGQWPGAGNRNRLLRWNINGGPVPSSTAPAVLGGAGNGGTSDVYSDVDRGPDGKLYTLQNRTDGTDTDSLRVYDTDGTTLLWGSLARTGSPDVLRTIRAVKVSPDGNIIALNRNDGRTWIIALTNGIPDMAQTNLIDTFITVGSAGTGRDVTFDAAGNLYVVSNTAEQLRVYSPGGSTKTITRSDGTFTVVRPPPVSVEVPDSSGHENGTDPVTFSLYRTGDTALPITVRYTLTGAATNGTDYATNVLSATIPAGQTNVEVVLTPIDDSEAEPTESIVLTLVADAAYDLKSPASGTAYIADNEEPVVTITSRRPNVEEGMVSYGPLFTITRVGETNIELHVNYDLTPDSVAAVGSDLNQPNYTLYMPPGVIQTNLALTLISDQDVEGDELLGITIDVGHFDYTVGTPSSAYTTIRDDDYPAECVLFSDDFDVDSSGNWAQLFGANNGLDDRSVFFFDNYSTRGVPSAPHSAGGTTRGLFLQVNKNNATANGSAGVNLYPQMKSFSGNYALRFDLYLSMGIGSTTEHALAGLNHSGNLTNRVSLSTNAINTTGGDGVFVAIETDGSNNRDWTAYTYPTPTSLPTTITNRTAASLTNQFSAPPYAFGGSPGNSTAPTFPYNYHAWSYVELAQSNGVISLRVNRHLLYSFPNPSGFNSGNIMVGMSDQFDSIGSVDNFAIIDNVRVVNLNPDPNITSIQLVPVNQVQIDFTAPCATIGELHLQSAASLTEPIAWADDNSATIVPNGGGFRATTAQNGGMRYYRIRR